MLPIDLYKKKISTNRIPVCVDIGQVTRRKFPVTLSQITFVPSSFLSLSLGKMFDVLCPSFIFPKRKRKKEVDKNLRHKAHQSAANKNDFIVFHFIDFHVRCFPILRDYVTGKFPTFFVAGFFWQNTASDQIVKLR